MKKNLLFYFLIITASLTNAQRTDTSSFKQRSKEPVKVNTNVIQPVNTAPALMVPTGKKKFTTGNIPKAKDLSISDLQMQKDLVSGLYTISCKITNVGTSNILLDPLRYFNCIDQSNFTNMVGFIVHCKIEPENCKLSTCGFVPSYMLSVYMPNGTAFTTNSYSSDEERTLKPGQSYIAKTINPVQVFWTKPSTCSSERIEVMLVLDPVNKIGDEDLSNNTIKHYFPVQN